MILPEEELGKIIFGQNHRKPTGNRDRMALHFWLDHVTLDLMDRRLTRSRRRWRTPCTDDPSQCPPSPPELAEMLAETKVG